MIDQKTLTIPLSLRENGNCLKCTTRLIDDIKQLKGVKMARATEDSCSMLIEYDPNFTSIEAIEHFANKQGIHLKNRYAHEHYIIEGLDCPDCATKLERAIAKIPGVTWVSLNFATSKIWFEYEVEKVTTEKILSAVQKAGYQYTNPDVSIVSDQLTLSCLTLTGLDCPDCADKLQRKMSNTEGIKEISLNFGASKITVKHDMSIINRADLITLAEEAGYKAKISSGEAEKGTVKFFSFQNRRLLSTILSGVFILCAAASYPFQASLSVNIPATGFALHLHFLFFLLSIFTGGLYVAKSAYHSMLAKTFDMNFLMSVAVIGALAIGEIAEGAIVVFLFSLGNLLQSYTMDKARNALRMLMDLAPKEATVKKGGNLLNVPVSELKVGDSIIVKPGERIPVDGLVAAGNSSVNEAPITGESQPVDKLPGSKVFAGSVNGHGSLEIRMEKSVDDSTLSRIIHLIEEAQAQKAPSQNFVDKFSRFYTPSVIMGAVLISAVPPLFFPLPFTEWFYRGLMLIVIACPCALVISTPVSIVSAIACSSGHGILIKGGAYLEEMGAIHAVAFDKTGTLTRGRPEVSDIVVLNGKSRTDLLRIAASLEMKSGHLLSRAIILKAKQEGIALSEPEEFCSFPGKGIKAKLGGIWGYAGNRKFFQQQGHSTDWLEEERLRLENEGKTTILVQYGALKGIIALEDVLRPEAKQCIDALKKKGIRHIAMLSGDNERVASTVAERLGIDEFSAGMLPEEKVYAIQRFLSHYRKAAMVGDGINDAPALAASTVGIAMGVAGTDTALETADVALMADDLLKLPFLVHLSRKTLSTIKTNIAFSIFVKAVFITLVFFGMANLWMAVAADTGTSLAVILYGMRLIKTRERKS